MGWILRKWREYRERRYERLREQVGRWADSEPEPPEDPPVAPADGSPRAISPKYQTWVYPGEDGWPFN